MKQYIPQIIVVFCLITISCGSNNTKGEDKYGNVTLGPIVHDTLSTEQIAQITKIYQTFQEVNSSTLEETITNFKRDRHPDNEIKIWLGIAAAYEKFNTANEHSASLEKKKDAFQLILLRSMMTEDEVKMRAPVTALSDKEVAEIFTYYNIAPQPLTIMKK